MEILKAGPNSKRDLSSAANDSSATGRGGTVKLQPQDAQAIPIFRLHYDQAFRRRFYQECETIFDQGFLSDHTYVRRFERAFAEFAGLPHAVATANGTQALELALRALEVRGGKVAVPANTFIATAIAVLNAGATPLVLDIEREGLGLDPIELESALQRERLEAVIVVHIGGVPSPRLPEVVRLCAAFGVPLVEDCAHAHGARLQGAPVGSFGVAGCFSFHTTKVLTVGEGGMVVTSDAGFHTAMGSVRRFGMNPELPIEHIREGSNMKLGEFQGLLGLLELERGVERLARRRHLAGLYRRGLEGSAWRLLQSEPLEDGAYYKQVVLGEIPRARIEEAFARARIALTGGVYYLPLQRQPSLRTCTQGRCYPVSEWFADHHVCPPCYPELEDCEVQRICEVLLELDAS